MKLIIAEKPSVAKSIASALGASSRADGFYEGNGLLVAISLLSVEQMSNGMLYAIWATPAALLFLGVGAGISRRVFAKHQVL